MELDPLNAEYLVTLGNVLTEAGRPVEAETQLKAAIDLDPASDAAHSSLSEVLEWDKRYAQSIDEAATAFFLRGQREQALNIKSVYQKSGFEAAKQSALHERLTYLLNLSKGRFVSPFEIAVIYAQLGDKEQTLAWLETAYQQRDVSLPCLRQTQDSIFGSVKNEPQFRQILARVHYPN